MSLQNRATVIGSISIFLWGTLAILTTLTGGQIPAFQLMAMTFSVAFLLMSVRWWCQGHLGLRHLRQPRSAWLIGVGAYFGYHFCYFEAMSRAPAVEVSMLAYLWPLLIVLLASQRPGEKLNASILAGALLALAGCWILVGKGSVGLRIEFLSGYLLALCCAFIWSGYSVAGQSVKKVPTDAVGWFCAVTALLALACHLQWESTLWPLSARQWMGVLGLGLGPVGIAFFTWDYGIKHGNISLLGVLAYSAPLISVVVLVLAGVAQPRWTIALASLAIVGGSLLAGLAHNLRPG
jgi:drug/metabolite transporter (DMT)-like permease